MEKQCCKKSLSSSAAVVTAKPTTEISNSGQRRATFPSSLFSFTLRKKNKKSLKQSNTYGSYSNIFNAASYTDIVNKEQTKPKKK